MGPKLVLEFPKTSVSSQEPNWRERGFVYNSGDSQIIKARLAIDETCS